MKGWLYLKYTDEQKQSVLSNEGNYLINAGAGSGKTRAFIMRIARMIKDGTADPDEILGLTFTKEAAEEMRKRLVKAIGKKNAEEVNLSTFHSFAYRILKSKFPSEYNRVKIMPQWWKMKTLNDFCQKSSSYNPDGLGLSCKAGDLASFISHQKMNLVEPGDMLILDRWTEGVATVDDDTLSYIYARYCEMAKKARMIEFDDMMLDLHRKLEEDSHLADSIKAQYTYIMIDETQDTNIVSMEIIKKISNGNVFAVGDFRQSIYGFINASIDNILDFDQNFKDVTLIDFKQNFRSTNNIVGISNLLINKSPNKKYKKFKEQESGRNEDGSPIKLVAYRDTGYEVKAISDKILELVDSGKYEYQDFAIIMRTNAQIGYYESVFTEQEIPVDVSSDKSFFDRREIADLLAYANHTVDPSDDISFRRVYNSPSRFISNKNQEIIDDYALVHDLTLEQAALSAGTNSNRMLAQYIEVYDYLRDVIDLNAGKFISEVIKKTNYIDHIEKTSPTTTDMEMRIEAIETLKNIAKKFRSIESFLAHVVAIRSNDSKKNEKAVKLMTVHASKGLEFEYVFLPTFTSENYPHKMSPDEEEERRLAYVGFTRAKNMLEISMPHSVSNGGGTFSPSPFLRDVAEDEMIDVLREVSLGSNVAFKEKSYTGGLK